MIHLERAEGGRQDLDFDAAIPLYVDRCYFINYLHDIVFGKGHSNILEDFLYVTFRSLQFVAMTRANAIIDIQVSRPLRWLSGKARELQNWSPVSMGEALDLVHDFFERAQYDGSLFLDPALDIFKPIADQQPRFAVWRKFLLEEDYVLSPDGSTKHLLYKLVKDELLEPKDATNVQTRAKTIEYLELQCRAGLKKMRDPKLALRDKLSSQVCILPAQHTACGSPIVISTCLLVAIRMVATLLGTQDSNTWTQLDATLQMTCSPSRSLAPMTWC